MNYCVPVEGNYLQKESGGVRSERKRSSAGALHDILVGNSRIRLGVKMCEEGLGGLTRDYGGQGLSCGLLHVAETAEVGEQALAGLRAYAWNIQQF